VSDIHGFIPIVPIQNVIKNEGPVYPLRSNVPERTGSINVHGPFQQTRSLDLLNWNGYPSVVKPVKQLSVVHILLDGYARADTFKRVFDGTEDQLLEFFSAEGFFTAPQATANYPNTILSTTSMLNLRYLGEAAWNHPPSLHSYVQQNAVVTLMRELGYSLEIYPGSVITEFVDTNLHSAFRLNELLASSSGFVQLPWLRQAIADYWHTLHRNRIDYTLTALETVELSHPTYLFAHILSPHPPFVHHREGTPVSVTRPFFLHDGSHYGPRDELYKFQYREQHEYITNRLISVIKNIKARCDNQCVIIVHSDHGSAYGLEDAQNKSDLQERFSVLFAIFLPDNDYQGFSEDLSLVNVYRILFNKLFYQTFPLEGNKHYWTDFSEIEADTY
jgi:hypothetical protein